MRKALPMAGALLTLALTACERAPQSSQTADFEVPTGDHHRLAGIIVYKNASCGCCKGWVEHLRRAGFTVEARDIDNLAAVKERVGVPYGMGSCHTAEIDGYFVEGHVPAEDIERLLAERPIAKGLVVPAMPIGSPGMEDPLRKPQPYDVILVGPDGTKSVFAHHGG